MKPVIGNWYRIQRSDSFEVVAFDEDDGTIECSTSTAPSKRWISKTGRPSSKPEPLWKSNPRRLDRIVDVDPEEDDQRGAVGYGEDDDRRQSAGKLEGLDLFEWALRIVSTARRARRARSRAASTIHAVRQQHVTAQHFDRNRASATFPGRARRYTSRCHARTARRASSTGSGCHPMSGTRGRKFSGWPACGQ